ncbi:hypothetical protein KUTeg_006442 [Tegillarca granosa]|uniref:Sulfotransferase domain-containing protein n=1 Tax=Tegillarca granosa TaxID=220873 RepID=A0ABQ9FGH6_TEGGR|nr:hypothetical protein KUTeg_006442 [Tegillarca granosa]
MPSGPSHIIILTYMRSGSTFIGDVLQEDPGVFYLFEPLRILQFMMRDNESIVYLNGNLRNYSNFLDLASDTLQDLSLCNLNNIGKPFWDDGFILKSKKAREFETCVKKEKNNVPRLKAMEVCANNLSTVCRNSNNIISKIIRIPMYILEPLMKKFPKMKIIHLLRDPRATIGSQSRFRVIRSGEHFEDDVTKFCSRVYEDLVIAKSFKQRYPGRILQIVYEDLAKNPIEVTKILYKFSNLHFTDKIKQFVENVTSASEIQKAEKTDCGYTCTLKSNSTAQAQKWRLTLPFGMVNQIDRLCRPLLRELKLRDIPSPEKLIDVSGYPLEDTDQQQDDFRWA